MESINWGDCRNLENNVELEEAVKFLSSQASDEFYDGNEFNQLKKYIRRGRLYDKESINIILQNVSQNSQKANILGKTIEESQKNIKRIIIYSEGIELFGDIQKFESWLNRESRALGNIQPKSLLNESLDDMKKLQREIGAINYGVFA